MFAHRKSEHSLGFLHLLGAGFLTPEVNTDLL
jgi:hypothetical protein